MPNAPPSATIMTGVVLDTMVKGSPKRPCAPTTSATPMPATTRLSSAPVTLPNRIADTTVSTAMTIGDNRWLSLRDDVAAVISTNGAPPK